MAFITEPYFHFIGEKLNLKKDLNLMKVIELVIDRSGTRIIVILKLIRFKNLFIMEIPNSFNVKTDIIESLCAQHPASTTINSLVIIPHLYVYLAFFF